MLSVHLLPYARQYDLRIGISLLFKNVGFDQAGVLRIDSDFTGEYSLVQNWSVAESRVARDRPAQAVLQMLGHDFAQDHVFGVAFRTDDEWFFGIAGGQENRRAQRA